MQVVHHIQNLLYRHDCVIIPDFGGIISNKVNARIENESDFYPPYKKLGFNVNLKQNDGLLVNEISAALQISFYEATDLISKEVKHWLLHLESKELVLDKIGKFSKNTENQITFDPLYNQNYLTSSFGFTNYTKEVIHADQNQLVSLAERNPNKVSSFVKYAATAAIVLTLSSFGWKGYEQHLEKKEYAKQQKEVESKIQSATFVIDNPLPTIELNVTKEIQKPFLIIAGSFQFKENALKKVSQLKSKGYDAFVVGKNKWGLTQVAYTSHADKYEAFRSLNRIRKTDSKDAWLLIKPMQ